MSPEDLVKSRIMFVNDSVWGNGIDVQRKPKLCKAICSAIGKDTSVGTICFKVSGRKQENGKLRYGDLSEIFNMIEVLSEMRYCACLSTANICSMEMYQTKKGTRFLYVDIDCESG
jgi:hypothetical protein